MKKSFKKTARTIHLWLGLVTGLIIFIVCITGCIYSFQKEIKLAAYPYFTVEHTEDSTHLPLSTLIEKYQKEHDHKILRIYDLKKENRSTVLLTLKNNEYFYIYLNPYTGDFIQEKRLAADFFTIVLFIHTTLLLGELGTQVIGWSVIMFIISLITGLILWFPKNTKVFKNKKGRKSKFGLKLKGPKNKVVYDLHSVLGFYAASLLIVLSITGIAWTFTWVDNALYTAVTFETKKEKKELQIDSTTFKLTTLDQLKKRVVPQRDDKGLFIYYLPNKNTDPLWIMSSPDEDQFGNTDNYYAHPDTGEFIETKYDEDKNAGEKFNSLYYDIHTGSLLGLPGKILIFLAGLIGASMPITGVMLYLHRRKKKKAKRKK